MSQTALWRNPLAKSALGSVTLLLIKPRNKDNKMTVKCKICGTEFESKYNRKSCSNHCSNIIHKKQQKEWRKINKERLIIKTNLWKKENKEHIKNYHSRYYKIYFNKHKKEILAREREKYKTDINVRLKISVRRRINELMKKKTNSSSKYLGVDIKTYKKYLENLFDYNMCWNNYGIYWEIDHIKPINTFNLNNKKESFEAFNYKNTRPLEKNENRSRPKDGSDCL